ncbi:MAPEG family protein [Thiotrichales bacterium 19S9-12]|nr:MAPEG family protein [Thiotrichales bacterium 19S9-11]MCF6812269.1 MAPEG family protein [Thiotrichales bacterium 19S9-12]
MNIMQFFSLECFILTGILIYLSVKVINNRKAAKDGEQVPDANNVVRAQANFIEYVPLALILHLGLVALKVNPYILLLLGALLVVARVMHAYGLLVTEMKKEPDYKFRKYGTQLTFLTLGLSALVLFLYGFFQ